MKPCFRKRLLFLKKHKRYVRLALPVIIVLAVLVTIGIVYAVHIRNNRFPRLTTTHPIQRFDRALTPNESPNTVRVNGQQSFYFCKDETNVTEGPGDGCTFHCVDPMVVGDGNSFDVSVEDLAAQSIAVTDVRDGSTRALGIDDTFRCEYSLWREVDKHNPSTWTTNDIWIDHFGRAFPHVLQTEDDGTKTELWPRKRYFYLGESFTFRGHFLNYRLLDHYDEIVVLPGMSPAGYWEVLYGEAQTKEMMKSVTLRNWSMGHQHVAGFKVLLEVNRRLRDGRCAKDALCGLRRDGGRLSAIQRRTLELLEFMMQGGAPLYLTYIPLHTDPSQNTVALVRQRRVEQWKQRRSAIAIFLSDCNRGDRTNWLDSIAKHYPVHNYGKCVGRYMTVHKLEDLGCRDRREAYHEVKVGNSTWRAKNYSGQSRYDTVRCVAQHYKYFFVLENTIESGYVTEKVYNALLSGAIPLVVSTKDVTDHVPLPESIVELLKRFPLHNPLTPRMYGTQKEPWLGPLPPRPAGPPYVSLKGTATVEGVDVYATMVKTNIFSVVPICESEETLSTVGDYLRELEDDDWHIREVFSWWQAVDPSEWSDSFRRHVFGASPLCNMCAGILQEKRR